MKNKNSDNNTYLTSNLGVPIANNQSSLTVGERGPGLLQDVQLIEKLSSFDRERVPERVVHATIVKLLLFGRSYLSFFLVPTRSISKEYLSPFHLTS